MLKQRDYKVLIPFFVSPGGIDTPFLLAIFFWCLYIIENYQLIVEPVRFWAIIVTWLLLN